MKWSTEHERVIKEIPRHPDEQRLTALKDVANKSGRGYGATYQKWLYHEERGEIPGSSLMKKGKAKKVKRAVIHAVTPTRGKKRYGDDKGIKPMELVVDNNIAMNSNFPAYIEREAFCKGLDIHFPKLGIRKGAIIVSKGFVHTAKNYIAKNYPENRIAVHPVNKQKSQFRLFKVQ